MSCSPSLSVHTSDLNGKPQRGTLLPKWSLGGHPRGSGLRTPPTRTANSPEFCSVLSLQPREMAGARRPHAPCPGCPPALPATVSTPRASRSSGPGAPTRGPRITASAPAAPPRTPAPELQRPDPGVGLGPTRQRDCDRPRPGRAPTPPTWLKAGGSGQRPPRSRGPHVPPVVLSVF